MLAERGGIGAAGIKVAEPGLPGDHSSPAISSSTSRGNAVR